MIEERKLFEMRRSRINRETEKVRCYLHTDTRMTFGELMQILADNSAGSVNLLDDVTIKGGTAIWEEPALPGEVESWAAADATTERRRVEGRRKLYEELKAEFGDA